MPSDFDWIFKRDPFWRERPKEEALAVRRSQPTDARGDTYEPFRELAPQGGIGVRCAGARLRIVRASNPPTTGPARVAQDDPRISRIRGGLQGQSRGAGLGGTGPAMEGGQVAHAVAAGRAGGTQLWPQLDGSARREDLERLIGVTLCVLERSPLDGPCLCSRHGGRHELDRPGAPDHPHP